MSDRLWMKDAACLGMDADLWFPERGEDQRAAKRVCARCQVIVECADYAMDHGIRWGIWGGHAEEERRSRRRNKRDRPEFREDVAGGCTNPRGLTSDFENCSVRQREAG